MSYIPIFTTGNVDVPSVKVDPKTLNDQPVFVSAYTGNILPGHPTFTTQTDDPSGKNPTYHGAILIENNIAICHQQTAPKK